MRLPRRRCRKSCCAWSNTASSNASTAKTLTCDVRIVAATNVDLPARAADGRSALTSSKSAFDVILSPAAHAEDIILLAEHFGQRIARELEGDFQAGLARR
jgi:transcriptional regulator with AAA-type ATPase domain